MPCRACCNAQPIVFTTTQVVVTLMSLGFMATCYLFGNAIISPFLDAFWETSHEKARRQQEAELQQLNIRNDDENV